MAADDPSQLLVAEKVRSATGVQCSEAIGRVLVAAAPFAPGELVLEEAPLLAWQEDPMQLFRDFLAAPAWKQALVLDLARSKLSAERAAEHEAVALSASQSETSIPIDTARQILQIVDTNAQQMHSEGEDGTRAGLFARASKAEHSCRPNCASTTQASPGVIRYHAVSPIEVGDRISISYLSELWSTPREARRNALLEMEKAFNCNCCRCVALDDCRGLACLEANCSGFCFQEGVSLMWRCGKCGSEYDKEGMKSRLHEEKRLLLRTSQLQIRAAAASSSSEQELVREELCNLMTELRKHLAPTHYLGILTLETLHTPEFFPGAGNVAAAKAYVNKLKLLDCIAAGCSSASCSERHAANAENWGDADAAIQFCLAAGSTMFPEALQISESYLPMIHMMASPRVVEELKGCLELAE
ncbi:unnamed protein product [Polarella glacialis]|uniref:SET domain-containing protein n=1 Tax=Polarella glacialis TaxID=89957 RepID=A0A813IPU3_POLGL|nr:unnamed protein product [Polarella glacialis]